MKHRTLFALAGCGTLICCGDAAMAQSTGLELVQVDSYFDTHTNIGVRDSWQATNDAFDVYRIFATFAGTTDDDRVTEISAVPTHPMSFVLASGSVHNYPGTDSTREDFPNDVPPVSLINEFDYHRAWETWVTVGVESGPSFVYFLNGGGAVFNHFAGSWYANYGTWATGSPTHGLASTTLWAGQGLPVPKVLIMQVCVTAGAEFSGQLNVYTGFGPAYDLAFVPGPGAMSLYFLAGLVGSRRRRSL